MMPHLFNGLLFGPHWALILENIVYNPVWVLNRLEIFRKFFGLSTTFLLSPIVIGFKMDKMDKIDVHNGVKVHIHRSKILNPEIIS